jgi:cytochrome oxidase Cu insertion factor (SCO1/SenC/PrrC family)
MFIAFTAFSQHHCRKKNDLNPEPGKVITEVGDFTVTDSDGNTWNLYDLLDQGKTVFLDLFFTT